MNEMPLLCKQCHHLIDTDLQELSEKYEAIKDICKGCRNNPNFFDVIKNHKDSGWRCLKHHEDGQQCIVCSECGEYIIPEDMDKPCKGVKD